MNYFTSDVWIAATWVSFKAALMTSLFSAILGLPTSYALVRYDFPGKSLLCGIIVSPLVIPIIITSIAIYFWYAKLKLIGSISGLVLAHGPVCLPVVAAVVTASLKGFDIVHH